ncbi:DUF3667 domain-containing protein [Parabacteroides sp. OttesenSCG-928-G21]|nr:DUF3667 domain-containing protein [Parabacteroides sp. OttesenSCG-928-G21]
MFKQKLREDKTCQNCNSHVESTFCPECGQKNIEPRKAFYYLFTDFFSTFFNYENSFWRTMKLLLFQPARLSQEYLAGRRASYLEPVKLYLFISFIAFLLPSLIPERTSFFDESSIKDDEFVVENIDEKTDEGLPNEKEPQQELKINEAIEAITNSSSLLFLLSEKYADVTTNTQLASVHNSLPEEERLSTIKYWMAKKLLRAGAKFKQDSFQRELGDFIVNNFSKIIFLYMPVFAFLLWIFHDKRKWYYFDHGIFTLHFISFAMIMISLLVVLNRIFDDWLQIEKIYTYIRLFIIGYITFYFFRAHSRFYGEPKAVSRIKAASLIFVNTILMTFSIVLYFIVLVILFSII